MSCSSNFVQLVQWHIEFHECLTVKFDMSSIAMTMHLYMEHWCSLLHVLGCWALCVRRISNVRGGKMGIFPFFGQVKIYRRAQNPDTLHGIVSHLLWMAKKCLSIFKINSFFIHRFHKIWKKEIPFYFAFFCWPIIESILWICETAKHKYPTRNCDFSENFKFDRLRIENEILAEQSNNAITTK